MAEGKQSEIIGTINHMKKKFMLIFMVLILVIGSLAACGKKEETNLIDKYRPKGLSAPILTLEEDIINSSIKLKEIPEYTKYLTLVDEKRRIISLLYGFRSDEYRFKWHNKGH